MLAALATSLLAFHCAPTNSFGSIRTRASIVTMGRKPGVSSPDELKAFVAESGANLIVLDVRNP